MRCPRLTGGHASVFVNCRELIIIGSKPAQRRNILTGTIFPYGNHAKLNLVTCLGKGDLLGFNTKMLQSVERFRLWGTRCNPLRQQPILPTLLGKPLAAFVLVFVRGLEQDQALVDHIEIDPRALL